MGILLEYRFVLILGVIALVWAIYYFFSIQNQHEKTEFLIDFRSQYLVLKEAGSSSTSLYDVLDRNLIYEKGSLLWRIIDKENPIHVIDNVWNINTINSLEIPSPNPWTLSLAFAFAQDYPNIRNYNADIGDIEYLHQMQDPTLSFEERGFNLDMGGYFLFILSSEQEAYRLFNSTFPEASLILNSTNNQRNIIALPYRDQVAINQGSNSLGSLVRNIPLNFSFQNIGGINLGPIEGLFFTANNSRYYFLENGTLRYYSLINRNRVTISPQDSYDSWRGFDISPNGSILLLFDSDDTLYRKNPGDSSLGNPLLSGNIVNPTFIDNNNFLYFDFTDSSIKKYNLISQNIDIIVSGVQPNYTFNQNTLLYRDGTNNLVALDLEGSSNTLLSDVTQIKSFADRIIIQRSGESQEIDIEGNIIQTLSAPIENIYGNNEHIFYHLSSNIYKDSILEDYIGTIEQVLNNYMVYRNNGNTFILDYQQPEGYTQEDNILELWPFVVDQNQELVFEVIGNFPAGTSYRLFVADTESTTPILNTAIQTDRDNIILSNNNFYIDDMESEFSTGFTGQQLLALTLPLSRFQFGSSLYSLTDFFPYGHWRFDTNDNLDTYISDIISIISRNYSLLASSGTYTSQTGNIFIQLEIIGNSLDNTISPEVTEINVYNKED